MPDTVVLPFWLVVLLGLTAIVSSYHHVFGPLLRRYLRKKEGQTKARLSSHLSRQLPEVLQVGRKARIEFFLNKPFVKEAIQSAVSQGQGTQEILELRVQEYAKELTPGFYALFYFKIGFYLARAYIRMMYDIVIVKPAPPSIAKIPQSASVVLVGNHRSNIDVMLQAYLSSRTSMVSFAAGEWAKAWPMSLMIRLSGSYIIRRNEPLPLYRKILAEHVRDLVRAKMPQGIFLEGGLTQDGRVQSVKLGLMSYIISALGDSNVDDIVFVPIAMNYDQIPEDRTLLSNDGQEFVGRSKFFVVTATFWSLCTMAYSKVRYGRSAYGMAAVSFGEPVSARAWLQERGQTATELSEREKKAIVGPLAADLIDTIKDMIPVLPISLVATVMMKAQGEAVSRVDLLDRSLSLFQDELDRKGVTSISVEEFSAKIDSAAKRLVSRGVLVENDDKFTVVSSNTALLEYIANSTEHRWTKGTSGAE